MVDLSYEKPSWDDIRPAHDWRNYISAEVRRLWPTFTVEQRLAIYQQANEQAQREEWD